MKNKTISHVHEEARIYREHYKPSFNILKLFKSVLGIVISGQSPSAHSYDYRRK